jgi:hypothetical protein
MENFIKNHIEQEIRKKNYKLSVGSVIKSNDDDNSDNNVYLVTIYGGANGHGRLTKYLSEIKDIVDLFNNIYMVNWDSDLLDDLFAITLLIKL